MTIILPGMVPVYGDPTGSLRIHRGRGGAAGNGLLNNLIAYWPSNEAGGANNALDLHTNALTLTQIHSPGAGAGLVYATARTGDGANDYFTRNSEALLQGGDNDLTIAIWVYLNSIAVSHCFVCKYDVPTDAGRDYLLWYYSVTNRFRVNVNSGIGDVSVEANTFGAPAALTWYHVLFHHDAVNNLIGLAVNNGPVDTVAFAAGLRAGNEPFTLMSLTDLITSRLDGRLGPVAMWKSVPGGGGVLTAAQQTALWNGGLGLPYAQFTT